LCNPGSTDRKNCCECHLEKPSYPDYPECSSGIYIVTSPCHAPGNPDAIYQKGECYPKPGVCKCTNSPKCNLGHPLCTSETQTATIGKNGGTITIDYRNSGNIYYGAKLIVKGNGCSATRALDNCAFKTLKLNCNAGKVVMSATDSSYVKYTVNNKPVCGNGIKENGEECDDGNNNNYDSCRNDCTLPYCGDGIKDSGEECDDGNNDDYDGCTNDCKIGECELVLTKTDSKDPVQRGDNFYYSISLENVGKAVCTGGGVELVEHFPDEIEFLYSNPLPSYDGNKWNFGKIYPGEKHNVDIFVKVKKTAECESSFKNEVCVWAFETGTSCIDEYTYVECPYNPECGNGILDSGEECDDGNTEDCDGCSSECLIEYCGDNIIQYGLGEECDDGNNVSGDGCSSNCKIEEEEEESVCGNGILEFGEECDDGNTEDCDGCSNSCIIEYCGDGITNNVIEECDDGNNVSGDGCSSNCKIEEEEEESVCGNGILEFGEECDDGNTEDCDGCSSTCENEYYELNYGGENDDDDDDDNDGKCVSDWNCSEWSDCFNGIKTRTCIDLNRCSNSNNKPSEILECENGNSFSNSSYSFINLEGNSEGQEKTEGIKIRWFGGFIGILSLILIILFILLLIFLFFSLFK